MQPISRRLIGFLGILAAGLCLMLVAAWLALPRWIEGRLVPDLAGRLGIAEAGIDLRHIGFSSLEAANIHIGQTVRLGHLMVDYRLGDLIDGRIERVALSGVTLYALRDEAGIRLKGAGPLFSASPGSAPTDLSAVWIGRIEVDHGLLVVEDASGPIKIPFALSARPEGEDLSRVEVRLELFPNLGPIQIMLRADTLKADLKAMLETRNACLDRFNPFLPQSAGLRLRGRLSAHAEAHLRFSPFEILALNGEAASADLRIDGPGFGLEAGGASAPLRLEWTAAQGQDRVASFSGALKLVHPLTSSINDLKMTAALVTAASGRQEVEITADGSLSGGLPGQGRIEQISLKATGYRGGDGRPRASATIEAAGRFDQPLPLSVDRLALTASGSLEQIKVRGDVAFSAADKILDGSVKIVPASFKGTFSGRLEDLSRWRGRFEAAPTRAALDLTAGEVNAEIQHPRISADFAGQGSAVSFTTRIETHEGRLDTGVAPVVWPQLRIDLNGDLDLANLPGSGNGRFLIQVPQPSMAAGQWRAGGDKIEVRGRLRPGRPPWLAGELQCENAHIVLPARNFTMEQAALYLPFQWPAVNPAAGRLNAESVRWQGFHPGRINATIRQTGSAVALHGELRNLIVEGMGWTFNAEAGASPEGARGNLDAVLDPWSPAAPLDLGFLAPSLSGLTAEGRLGCHAALALEAGGIQSNALVRLAGASLEAPARNIHVDGIDAELRLVDLIGVRSAPGQVVHVGRADFGNLQLSDAQLQFQVEGPSQILLEKGGFGWCGGRIYAEAMRFSPADGDYDLTLFCDRLYLVQVLHQLGGLAAEGEGTVNGRIPLNYRQGKLRFKDGFLYSTPGVGGKIRLEGMERLTGGIAPQTLEYAQLALASEALKNYDYTWAKVGIDSQGDQLALRLQFDGKPAQPLPFVYHQELGRFMRVEADSPGSRFQGITLDVKLGLPLDEIIQYGGLMKMIE